MITPLGEGCRTNRVWLSAALVYTVGGALGAMLVGAVLGRLGRLVGCTAGNSLLWGLFALWCLLLALRDGKLISFRLPQVPQQAPQQWQFQFDFGSTLFMWGIYIGVGVLTFIVFSGFYALAASAVISGSPLFGAALMFAYWLGRAAPVWIAPSLLPAHSMKEVTHRGIRAQELFRKLSWIWLLVSAIVGGQLALHIRLLH